MNERNRVRVKVRVRVRVRKMSRREQILRFRKWAN